MISRFSRFEWAWLALLLAGVCAIYLPGMGNALVFDDVRLLEERRIWRDYGNLFELRQRMLAYGSFVWVEAVFGEGWWKQRLVNMILHVAVVLAVLAFYRQLLARVAWPADLAAQPHFAASRDAALLIALLLFAFNPVAVYAVGYLIQRSMLMATLFVVLGLTGFTRGLTGGRAGWYVLAVLAYVAAVLSKEHALMAPLVAFALYVFVRRPAALRVGLLLGGALLAIAAAVGFLLSVYGQIIGTVFDDLSREFIDELNGIAPGIMERAYPLSLINQAALFFYYGFLWLVPVVGWMSIDLRPPFPLTLWSWPHTLGALAFVATCVVTVWLLFRRNSVWSFAGLCLTIPLTLFATEFVVVWVQDPFVLYRSYMWAVALPGLAVLALVGVRAKYLWLGGVLVAVVFAGLAFERVVSMRDKHSVWADAADKTGLYTSPSAVGRWRPYINRGAYFMEQRMPELAYRDFSRAIELGERGGRAHYNLGVSLQLLERLDEAAHAYDVAERSGQTSIADLYANRAEIRMAQGRLQEAVADFRKALELGVNPGYVSEARHKLANAALAIGEYQLAADQSGALLETRPDDTDALLINALARVALGDSEAALEQLDLVLSRVNNPSAHYGRAIAYRQLGDWVQARLAIEHAIRIDPNNPAFRVFQRSLQQAAEAATEAPAATEAQ